MKYNYTNRISLSCYEYAFRTWPLYDWSVKVSYTHSAVEISRKPPPPPPFPRHTYTEIIKSYAAITLKILSVDRIGFLYFYRPININLSAD